MSESLLGLVTYSGQQSSTALAASQAELADLGVEYRLSHNASVRAPVLAALAGTIRGHALRVVAPSATVRFLPAESRLRIDAPAEAASGAFALRSILWDSDLCALGQPCLAS